MTIKVLLADDHSILRHGLAEALAIEEDIEIVGQAKDGLSAIKLVRKLTPDIVVMDISMPDINGMDATREITRDFPEVKVIGLSMHSAKKFVREMFKAGAAGYVLKDCDFDELALAIRTVMAGKTYMTPEITGNIVDNYLRTPDEPDEPLSFANLTKREREVLQLLAEGNTTKQIGLKLHISPKTVEAHRLRVMDKLEIDNVAQLTKFAIQEGLTSLDM